MSFSPSTFFGTMYYCTMMKVTKIATFVSLFICVYEQESTECTTFNNNWLIQNVLKAFDRWCE